MRSKIKHIEFPVFVSYSVHVEITSDISRSMNKYKQTRDIPFGDDTHAITVHVEDNGLSFMFLPYNAPVCTIAHESWHVIKNMMEYVGIDLDSETVAYHLGYLVDKVVKFRG